MYSLSHVHNYSIYILYKAVMRFISWLFSFSLLFLSFLHSFCLFFPPFLPIYFLFSLPSLFLQIQPSKLLLWGLSRAPAVRQRPGWKRYIQSPGNSLYKVPDAVPPIHAVSSHVATDKDPSKFRSIFRDNLQPIATHGKKARGTVLVDIGCSSKRAPLSVSYKNEISSDHIGSCCC